MPASATARGTGDATRPPQGRSLGESQPRLRGAVVELELTPTAAEMIRRKGGTAALGLIRPVA